MRLLTAIATLLLMVSSYSALAQYEPNYDTTDNQRRKKEDPTAPDQRTSTFVDDLYVGADFNFWLANQAIFLELSPFVGYNVWKDLSVGAGIFYQYIRDGFINENIHSYGVNVFSRYLFFERLILHTEYEYAIVGYNPTTRFLDPGTSNALYLGAGYAQPLGDAGYFHTMLMYDFLEDEYNPHPKILQIWPLHVRFGLVFWLDR